MNRQVVAWRRNFLGPLQLYDHKNKRTSELNIYNLNETVVDYM